MSLYNDYLDSAEKAKFYGQQAGWAGDKRQQDYYNAEADRYFIMAMNQKMKEDEREAQMQRYYAQQQYHSNAGTGCGSPYNHRLEMISTVAGIVIGLIVCVLFVF